MSVAWRQPRWPDVTMPLPGARAVQPWLPQAPPSAECVHNPLFDQPYHMVEKTLFSECGDTIGRPAPPIRVAPGHHLRPEHEKRLFLQFNYARLRIGQLMRQVPLQPAHEILADLSRWVATRDGTRSTLTTANIGLVMRMARCTRVTNVDFDDLVSEGHLVLLRCIDKFDVARGFRFSTYAGRAICKSFCRLSTQARQNRNRLPMDTAAALEDIGVNGHERLERWQDALDALKALLSENAARLTAFEKIVLNERFPLDDGVKGRTLSQVAQTIGLTDERVRQIQISALGKLRKSLDRRLFSRPGDQTCPPL